MSLKKIIVLRHAESDEDVDPNLNGILQDHEISITQNGRGQIRGIISSILRVVSLFKGVKIYSSTSNRAQETASEIGSELKTGTDATVDSRIRNLNWGNTTPKNIERVKKERYQAGVLYYQFPGGDHSPTFVSDIGKFVEELLLSGGQKGFPEAVIIVTHGFALRIITKFLLGMSDDDFRWVKNPGNCYIAEFDVDDSGGIRIKDPLPTRDPIKD